MSSLPGSAGEGADTFERRPSLHRVSVELNLEEAIGEFVRTTGSMPTEKDIRALLGLEADDDADNDHSGGAGGEGGAGSADGGAGSGSSNDPPTPHDMLPPPPRVGVAASRDAGVEEAGRAAGAVVGTVAATAAGSAVAKSGTGAEGAERGPAVVVVGGAGEVTAESKGRGGEKRE